jgi:hypothetical protein
MNRALLENAVALSASVHTSEQYHDFYRANADAVSGFPGIFDLVAQAAEAFTIAERGIEWDGEWIDAIDILGDHLTNWGGVPTQDEIEWMAAAAIGYALAAMEEPCGT